MLHRHGWGGRKRKLKKYASFLLWHRFICSPCLLRGTHWGQLPFFTDSVCNVWDGLWASQRSLPGRGGRRKQKPAFVFVFFFVCWMRRGDMIAANAALWRQRVEEPWAVTQTAAHLCADEIFSRKTDLRRRASYNVSTPSPPTLMIYR